MQVVSCNAAGVFDEHGVYYEGWQLVVTLTDLEAADLLSRYEPGVGTSPGVTDARTMARPILDAVRGD